MSKLEILSCGPGVSVQDTGRIGYRRFGVSTAGAMDRAALALANALVGNTIDAAAVEVPMVGATFRLTDGERCVAAFGAGATLRIDGVTVPPNGSGHASASQTIEIGPARAGVYTILALSGGIAGQEDLGSRSSHLRTGIGPDALAPGRSVPLLGTRKALPHAFTGPNAPGAGPIRVVPGPQDDFFSDDTRSAFLGLPFRVSPRSDRMGIRLDGPRIVSAQGHDILSEGVVPGCIQVPGDGRPIVLGRDCQTTGGYPKIATVISADLGRLAQFPAGTLVRFQVVSPEDAIAAARDLARWQRSLASHLRPAGTRPTDLRGHNLISGVSNAEDC